MPLGSHVPEWVALQQELELLVTQTSSDNAYVLDAWGNVWCAARPALGPTQKAIIKIALAEVDALQPPLQRGGRLDRMLEGMAEHSYARSFATVYVLLVSFRGSVSTLDARRTIAMVLPRIEALTVALPPPDGPDAGSAQGFGVP
jgi:hypothetical protein